jgi:chemotaxis protein methyltransferase CheR
MDGVLLERFQQLVAARCGLHLRPRDRENLLRAVSSRVRSLKLPGAEAYAELLECPAAPNEREWDWLVAHLTNTESYFFRDHGQMGLLRDRLLPELIRRNGSRRSPRLWSAGCATGEEAYSLAILLAELLPAHETRDARVLGTDINERALEKARRGIYTAWSFRRMDPELRGRYFHAEGSGFALNAPVRSQVTFRRLNLLTDSFPDGGSGIGELDLILCRNVFIYLAREAVPIVLRKLAGSLRDGGYLMTGHTELHAQELGQLQPRIFPGSVVYQRVITEKDRIEHANVSSALLRIRTSRPSRSHSSVEALRDGPQGAADGGAPCALYEQARALADQGRHAEAADCCRQAIAGDPTAVAPHRLLAQIAEERGEFETARECLRKVIYLAPSLATAYLDLAALYERDGDAARARKMSAAARAVLEAADPAAPAGAAGEPTAGELLAHLRTRTRGGS